MRSSLIMIYVLLIFVNVWGRFEVEAGFSASWLCHSWGLHPWIRKIKVVPSPSAPQMWPCLTLTRRASSCTWRRSSRCSPRALPWRPSRRWRRCRGPPQPASPGWRQRSTTRSRPSSASPSRLDTHTHTRIHTYTHVYTLRTFFCDTVTAHRFGVLYKQNVRI